MTIFSQQQANVKTLLPLASDWLLRQQLLLASIRLLRQLLIPTST
jgi:hypothetical protein